MSHNKGLLLPQLKCSILALQQPVLACGIYGHNVLPGGCFLSDPPIIRLNRMNHYGNLDTCDIDASSFKLNVLVSFFVSHVLCATSGLLGVKQGLEIWRKVIRSYQYCEGLDNKAVTPGVKSIPNRL